METDSQGPWYKKKRADEDFFEFSTPFLSQDELNSINNYEKNFLLIGHDERNEYGQCKWMIETLNSCQDDDEVIAFINALKTTLASCQEGQPCSFEDQYDPKPKPLPTKFYDYDPAKIYHDFFKSVLIILHRRLEKQNKEDSTNQPNPVPTMTKYGFGGGIVSGLITGAIIIGIAAFTTVTLPLSVPILLGIGALAGSIAGTIWGYKKFKNAYNSWKEKTDNTLSKTALIRNTRNTKTTLKFAQRHTQKLITEPTVKPKPQQEKRKDWRP